MIASAIHINEQIADRLASDGWYVGESIFDAALGARLRDRAHELARRVHERLSAELPGIIETTIRDFLAEPEILALIQPRA